MDKFKEEWIAYQKTSLQSQITNLAYENFELEQEISRLREAARWIPVDSGKFPAGAHGVLTYQGAAYWVRKPEEE